MGVIKSEVWMRSYPHLHKMRIWPSECKSLAYSDSELGPMSGLVQLLSGPVHFSKYWSWTSAGKTQCPFLYLPLILPVS